MARWAAVGVVAVLAMAQCTHAQLPYLDTYFTRSEQYMQQAIEEAVETILGTVLQGRTVGNPNVTATGLQPTGTAASCPYPNSYHGAFVTTMFETLVRVV